MPKFLLACCLVALTAVDPTLAETAQAAVLTQVGQIKLPAGSHDTALPGSVRLFGFPVQMRIFEASIAVAPLIRFFSKQLPVLRDLHVLPGSALLSGQSNGSSWVVHLQGMAQGGTRGTLSILESPSSGRLDLARPEWIPGQARLLLDLSTTEGPWRVTEQIWSHSIAPINMRPILHAALTRMGGRRTGAEFGGGRWQLPGQDLIYSVVPLDGGSAIFARMRQRV